MTELRPPSAWRLPIVLLLTISAPLLAVVAWIFLSGSQRRTYWRSWWTRGGLAVAVIGSLPLLVVGIAAALGLWPDPRPNPVGFGLLFVFSAALGSLMALVGILWTHYRDRRS